MSAPRTLGSLISGRMSAINGIAKRNPLKTSVYFTGAKAGLADAVVQTQLEGRTEIDRPRLATFCLFGFAYQGGFQYWWFNVVWEGLFPGRAFKPVLQKILATNLISDPIFFFPTFYTMREAMTRPADALTKPFSIFCDALAKYRQNYFQDWMNTWSVWFPGHLITYGVCPMHLRMPWVAGLSFGYLLILSRTRGEQQLKDEG